MFVIMSKRTKAQPMSLGAFYHHVESTRQVQVQARKSMGGRLSDRLKGRAARHGTSTGTGTMTSAGAAAKVIGTKASMDLDLDDTTLFPSLSVKDANGELVTVECPEYQLQGMWTQGVQPVLDAVHLPDPKIKQEQERRAKLEERRRSRSRRQIHYEEPSWNSSDEYEPSSPLPAGIGAAEGDEEWDDVL